MMQKIAPCFWCDGNAEELARFYTSIFGKSKIERIMRYPADAGFGKKGDVCLVEFELEGQSYAALKPSNVEAVRTLIGWTATGRPKALHYVSTLSVIDPSTGPELVTEASGLESWRGLIGGYSQSKWVGDTLARQAQALGLPVSVYRLGTITGDRAQAICNETDMIWRVPRSSVQRKAT